MMLPIFSFFVGPNFFQTFSIVLLTNAVIKIRKKKCLVELHLVGVDCSYQGCLCNNRKLLLSLSTLTRLILTGFLLVMEVMKVMEKSWKTKMGHESHGKVMKIHLENLHTFDAK